MAPIKDKASLAVSQFRCWTGQVGLVFPFFRILFHHLYCGISYVFFVLLYFILSLLWSQLPFFVYYCTVELDTLFVNCPAIYIVEVVIYTILFSSIVLPSFCGISYHFCYLWNYFTFSRTFFYTFKIFFSCAKFNFQTIYLHAEDGKNVVYEIDSFAGQEYSQFVVFHEKTLMVLFLTFYKHGCQSCQVFPVFRQNMPVFLAFPVFIQFLSFKNLCYNFNRVPPVFNYNFNRVQF